MLSERLCAPVDDARGAVGREANAYGRDQVQLPATRERSCSGRQSIADDQETLDRLAR